MGKVVHTKRRPYPAVSGVPGFVVGQGSVFMLYNEPQSDLVHRPCCPPHTPKVRETSYILISDQLEDYVLELPTIMSSRCLKYLFFCFIFFLFIICCISRLIKANATPYFGRPGVRMLCCPLLFYLAPCYPGMVIVHIVCTWSEDKAVTLLDMFCVEIVL